MVKPGTFMKSDIPQNFSLQWHHYKSGAAVRVAINQFLKNAWFTKKKY